MERPHSANPRTDRHHLPWLALLTGLAVLLNAWPVPLYFGIHLLLGSVPPILALLLWRSWWAVPMAVLASLQTIRLWGHPWAVVIFGLEMLWLGVALHRWNGPPGNEGNGRVVLFAMGYWLLVGCPLVLLFYGGVMGIDAANLVVTTVKQAFNGVLNAVLAFGALILIQTIRSGHNRGPGVSLRGVIMALALLAITLPALLVGLAAGHQLEVAVQRGTLDGLETVNLALSRASAREENTQLLMRQLGEAMAYRRIEPNGRVDSSDPALFRRLDTGFSDGGRSNVHHNDLAILIPKGKLPSLRKWVNGYWSYSRQYGGGSGGGMTMVQVVEPARTIVTRLQRQSAALLAVTFLVVAAGAFASLWLGSRFEREFLRVLPPTHDGQDPLRPLQLSAMTELRELAQLINHRILQVDRLSTKLRQANDTLRSSRAELKRLLRSDPLTGTGNREALDERLREEVDRSDRSGEALSALVIRIDDLGRINREFGRRAGDALLQGQVQAALKRLRRTDHLYRWSSDCFVLLAIGCDGADAIRLGEELRTAMTEVYLTPAATSAEPDPPEVRSAVSVGVSTLNPPHDTGEMLLQRGMDAVADARGQGAALAG